QHCADIPAHARLFAPSVQLLYQLDVVDEDAVLSWYHGQKSQSLGIVPSSIREKAEKFVTWLEEAEEEEEEEEDEDEDEDEED
ncbi:hypothetical protein BZG36_05500, partial [Bifiguratus adelaidae]